MKFTPSGLVAACAPWSPAAGSNAGPQVQVKRTRTIGDAVAHLKGPGMQILAPIFLITLSISAKLITSPDLCILMGDRRKQASRRKHWPGRDQDIIIPMIGMVQSLNVSVASALIL